MGKKVELSDERIMGYLREGWRFRRKRVGGKYEYIVRKRGQRERSLGPYDLVLWDRILALEYRYHLEDSRTASERERVVSKLRLNAEKHEGISKARDKYMWFLKVDRSIRMSKECVHIVDGFCQYWVWEGERIFFSYLEDSLSPGAEYRKWIERENGPGGWIIRANRLYCFDCSAYETR